ncbi:protein of unknown function [Methylocella tundrae]|uniref:Uncharacterized protein n=1 Tax=Methylocella tundrae TaxID=227605 RepID=A0A4U8YWK5_METTU|nr:protein of unknown function [Methylocella tundrae]
MDACGFGSSPGWLRQRLGGRPQHASKRFILSGASQEGANPYSAERFVCPAAAPDITA